MAITRINEFQAAEGKEQELYAFLQGLIPYISSSEGNLQCDVLRKKDSKAHFVVLEKWESEEAHQESVANYPKEEMQAAMSLFGAPPVSTSYH